MAFRTYLPSKEGPLWASPGVDGTLRCSPISATHCSFKQPMEKKINRKSCQILVDPGAARSTWNPTHSRACGWDPGKTRDVGQDLAFPNLSQVPSWKRKISFYVVPSFPNPNPLVSYPLSPRDRCCLLDCLILGQRTLLGNHQVGGAKILPDSNVGRIPFWGRVLLTTACPPENCPSLLSFGYLWKLLWILGV